MKPKLLKIEGLNSFQHEQTIDFDKLIKGGIFGIFGNTGSGKSTILDAITLSLYGDIPRKSNDFINSDMETASIFFEFELNNNSVRKTYVVERIYKRNKDKSTNCKSARIYEYNGDNINILAEGSKAVSKQCEDLIGLKSDDFTRTVLLPQGKFSEFLTLTSAPRNEMIERILHLEEYGNKLEQQFKKEKTKIKDKLNSLDSKISVYDNLTSEMLEAEKSEYSKLIDTLDLLKARNSYLKEEFDNVKEIFLLQQERDKLKQEFEFILSKNDSIELQKQKLNIAQKADIVYPYIESLEKTELKISKIDLDSKLEELKFVTNKLDTKAYEYNKAKAIKEDQYEILLEKEYNLKQAIEILAKVKALESEKEGLRNEYKSVLETYKSLKAEKTKLETCITETKSKLEFIASTKEGLKVSSEYKQKVEIAYEAQTKFIELEAQLNDYKLRLEKYKKDISTSQAEIEKLEGESNEVQLCLQSLDSKLDNLTQTEYSNDKLLDLQTQYNSISAEYISIKDKEDKREILNSHLKALNDSIMASEALIKAKTADLSIIEAQVEELNLQKKALEILNSSSILAEMLENDKPCPVCGSLNHPSPAKKFKSEAMDLINKKLETAYLSLDEAKTDLSSLNLENFENVKKLKETELELEKLNNQIGKTTSHNLDLQRTNLKAEFEILKKNIESSNNQKQALRVEINEKVQLKTKLEIEKARIIERQSKDNSALKEIEAENQLILCKYYKLNKELLEFKESLNLDDFKKEKEKLIQNENQYSSLEKDESDTRHILSSVELEYSQIITKISDIEKNLHKIVEVGKEKASIIDNFKADITNLSDNKDPNLYILEIRNQIETIYQAEKNLLIELESVKLEKQNLENIYYNLKTQIDILTDLHTTQLTNLESALNETEFETADEVKAYLIPKHEQLLIIEDIENYENEYSRIFNNIESINSKLNGKSVSDDYFNDITLKLNNLNLKVDKANQDLAVKSHQISEMEQRLKELQNLNKSKADVLHRLELINEILELIKGKDFVKFISKRQMSYITKEATRYLKKITKNRYSIELDDNNDFIMRDDFLGGIKRRTETLSGGELFVTSLSLALALSSQIQLKNKAPLEFFFLDEGFGSLDMNLLDTVIDALEKLHTENLNIGIISHVEELKNRIPAKLIITPANQGLSGSKVSLEI